jgi:hypothetical protein
MTADRPCPECGTPPEELCVHMERLLAALRREAAEADNAGEGEFLDPAGRLPGHPEYCAEGCIHLPASPTTSEATPGATPDAGREAIGRCGDEWPTNGENYGLPFKWCALPAGHAGWHRSDRGTEWLRRAMTTPDAGRADDADVDCTCGEFAGTSVRYADCPVHCPRPAGRAGDALREAMKETLRLYGIRGERLGSLRPGSVADALLALPEVQALMAVEKERDELRATVEALAVELEAREIEARTAGRVDLATGYLISAEHLRALDGSS